MRHSFPPLPSGTDRVGDEPDLLPRPHPELVLDTAPCGFIYARPPEPGRQYRDTRQRRLVPVGTPIANEFGLERINAGLADRLQTGRRLAIPTIGS
jgi:hypothetical protein